MNSTAPAYPLVTAPVGQWPMRCTFTGRTIKPGQQIALSSLGYISLAILANPQNQLTDDTEAVSYLNDVLQAYCQRQGGLAPARTAVQQVAEDLLTRLIQSIPPGQSRYLHQQLLATNLAPWLNALQ